MHLLLKYSKANKIDLFTDLIYLVLNLGVQSCGRLSRFLIHHA